MIANFAGKFWMASAKGRLELLLILTLLIGGCGQTQVHQEQVFNEPSRCDDIIYQNSKYVAEEVASLNREIGVANQELIELRSLLGDYSLRAIRSEAFIRYWFKNEENERIGEAIIRHIIRQGPSINPIDSCENNKQEAIDRTWDSFCDYEVIQNSPSSSHKLYRHTAQIWPRYAKAGGDIEANICDNIDYLDDEKVSYISVRSQSRPGIPWRLPNVSLMMSLSSACVSAVEDLMESNRTIADARRRVEELEGRIWRANMNIIMKVYRCTPLE